MSIIQPSLATRHADLTQRAILDAAIDLLEQGSVTDLSVRAVARQAGMSERTVFRYFANREDFLDGVAREMSRRLDAPPVPSSIEELLAYPDAIFARFEATASLTKAALHTELYDRIRTTDAVQRGLAIQQLIDRAAPRRSEQERKLAAANIRYHLIATTWHYYRFYFGLSLDETIRCTRMLIAQTLSSLGIAVIGKEVSPRGRRKPAK